MQGTPTYCSTFILREITHRERFELSKSLDCHKLFITWLIFECRTTNWPGFGRRPRFASNAYSSIHFSPVYFESCVMCMYLDWSQGNMAVGNWDTSWLAGHIKVFCDTHIWPCYFPNQLQLYTLIKKVLPWLLCKLPDAKHSFFLFLRAYWLWLQRCV